MSEREDGLTAEEWAALERAAADWIGFLLESIEQGNMAAIHDVLEEFVIDAETGRASDPRVLAFVAERLRRVIDGDDVRQVFPSPSKDGSPHKTREHFEQAVEVVVLMRDGSTEAEAIETVAGRHRGVAAASIRNRLQQYRDAANRRADYLKARMGK